MLARRLSLTTGIDLPLPKGEGRGEGEGTSDRLRLPSCRKICIWHAGSHAAMHFSPRPDPRPASPSRRAPRPALSSPGESLRSTWPSVRKRSLPRSVPATCRTSCASCVLCRPPAQRQGTTNSATFYATPDYLAVGSDEDYFLIPISPNTAQRIADALGCSLPTPKMVDEIYAAAEVKLAPAPIPPTPAMTTVPVFSNHNAIVRAQRAEQLQAHPLGALVAGHQKDVVISAKLAVGPGQGCHLRLAPDQRRADPAALSETRRLLG